MNNSPVFKTCCNDPAKSALKLLTVGAIAWQLAMVNSYAQTEQSDTGSQSQTIDEGSGQYTCPMHPHFLATDPAGICPICGMDLVPASSGGGNSGVTEVAVSPEMIQTMGIRTTTVAREQINESLRLFGTVETNERLENVSVSKFEGWIEGLSVNAEGDTVNRGDLLFRVYSPNLIAAQKDYINSMRIGNKKRIDAVKQRLRSLGMQNSTIHSISHSGQVVERVPVYAETGGTVAKLLVREGDYIKPGSEILRLQSYDDVWVIASIAERDLPLIRTGQSVSLTFPSAPNADPDGVVDYIYPTIDTTTRTARVRIEVDNAAGDLRPGAYADIDVSLQSDSLLVIPTESVLYSSLGAHVIVSLGDGRFKAKQIEVGMAAAQYTQVTGGLEEGERVVSSGQFMLDSEVNLREGFSKMEAPNKIDATPDTPLQELPVDATTLAGIDHFTDMALYFHEALIDGYEIDVYFVDPALQYGEGLIAQFDNTRLVPIIESASDALRNAKQSPDGEGLAQVLADLVGAMEPWFMQGAPIRYRDAGVAYFTDNASGRAWIQEGDDPINPYGDGDATRTPWPDPMAGIETETAMLDGDE
ncbi:efflux transporter periplasmic adaptor subunit [Chromatiales bacterium (ex Bugula neritina AB1)]|nr:efflux transporter periplasmic adaptor subunit [Chromatiales bacterium (ex Bugula neritina AB1)]